MVAQSPSLKLCCLGRIVGHSERARSAGPSTARRPPTRDLSRRAFDKGNVYGMAANAETDHLALEIG